MLPKNSRLIYDNQTILSALNKLSEEMNTALAEKKLVVLCVMQGGLIFSGQLIPRLTFQLEIDYIHATRYRNGTTGHDVEWKAEPVTNLSGRDVLILDDILDEGVTLKAIINYCRKQGAQEIFSAVLLQKLHARGDQSVQASFTALEVEDSYVFGFGMDVEGQHRQLNAIYALS